MTEPLLRPSRSSVAASTLALLTASGTLICCVLPAVLVALGAGAVLAGLVSAVPQLIWLSAHKAPVFGLAGAMLIFASLLLWRARRAPCPIDRRLGLHAAAALVGMALHRGDRCLCAGRPVRVRPAGTRRLRATANGPLFCRSGFSRDR